MEGTIGGIGIPDQDPKVAARLALRFAIAHREVALTEIEGVIAVLELDLEEAEIADDDEVAMEVAGMIAALEENATEIQIEIDNLKAQIAKGDKSA